MILEYLCAPSIIYLVFGLTQVCLDVYQGYYNTALMKIIVTTIFTLLLNAMCMSGMTVIAWMIIAIPFILMSVIISMLLFVFGLNPKTGRVLNTVNGHSISERYNSLNNNNNCNNNNSNKKRNIDKREHSLLYGENDELTRKELLYLWNKRYSRDNDSRFFLNSDYLDNILDDNHNSDKTYNKKAKNILNNYFIKNKKITFKIGDSNIVRNIYFYDNNRVKYNSENGFYFVNGYNVKINNNLDFVFKNKKLKPGDTFEVYDKNEKLDDIIKIISVKNI